LETINPYFNFYSDAGINVLWSPQKQDIANNLQIVRIATAPPVQPRFALKSLFANNAQVFYKSHSLSTGGGGSGVRNHRLKKRKT